MEIRTKRIYEEPAGDDGARILVDRNWPRGISRERARLAAMRARARRGPVTLLYAARDTRHNNADVLAEALRRGLPSSSTSSSFSPSVTDRPGVPR